LNPLNFKENPENQGQEKLLQDHPMTGELTFGPNETWKREWSIPWRWCNKQGAEDTFRLIIDVFNLQGTDIKELPFLNILKVLTHDHAFKLLSNWAIDDPHSQALFQLAKTARCDINNDEEAISQIAPAKTNPKQRLPADQYYLLRLFLNDSTHAESDRGNWMSTLLIWLLIHAMYRIERGITFDKSLKAVAGYLRSLPYNEVYDWQNLMQLQPPDEGLSSFACLNYHLIHQVTALRSTKQDSRTLLERYQR